MFITERKKVLALFLTKKNVIHFCEAIILLVLFYWGTCKILDLFKMKFTIQYDYVPAISRNVKIFKIDVHYRGVDVGDVTSIKLSKDQQHVEFKVKINQRNLKIPKNSIVRFKSEAIGPKYIDIDPTKAPPDGIIENGDIVDGTEASERIDSFVIDELTNGQAGMLIKNLKEITDVLKTSLTNKENEKLLTQSAEDLTVIIEKLKRITTDPSLERDVKSTFKNSSGTMKSLNEILRKKEIKETINKTPETMSKALNSIEDMNTNMNRISKTLPETTEQITQVNSQITEVNDNLCKINTKVPPIPQSLVDNAEKLVAKGDCLATELSNTLSKRFLLFKLFFGHPGKNLKTCAKCRIKKAEKK